MLVVFLKVGYAALEVGLLLGEGVLGVLAFVLKGFFLSIDAFEELRNIHFQPIVLTGQHHNLVL